MDDIYYRSRNDYRWKDGAPSIAYMLQTTAGGTTEDGVHSTAYRLQTATGGATTGGRTDLALQTTRGYSRRDDYRRTDGSRSADYKGLQPEGRLQAEGRCSPYRLQRLQPEGRLQAEGRCSLYRLETTAGGTTTGERTVLPLQTTDYNRRDDYILQRLCNSKRPSCRLFPQSVIAQPVSPNPRQYFHGVPEIQARLMKMESPASVSELHDGLRQRSYQQADTEQVKASYEQLRCPRNDTTTSSMDDIYYRSRNDYRWKDGAPSIAYMLQTTAGGTTTDGRRSSLYSLQTTDCNRRGDYRRTDGSRSADYKGLQPEGRLQAEGRCSPYRLQRLQPEGRLQAEGRCSLYRLQRLQLEGRPQAKGRCSLYRLLTTTGGTTTDYRDYSWRDDHRRKDGAPSTDYLLRPEGRLQAEGRSSLYTVESVCRVYRLLTTTVGMTASGRTELALQTTETTAGGTTTGGGRSPLRTD